MSCFTLGTKENNVSYRRQLILNCSSVGSHRHISYLCLLVHMQDLLLFRVYYKNAIVLYADHVVTNVCFHIIISSIMNVDCFPGSFWCVCFNSKIHKSTSAGFKHSKNNYSINIVCITIFPKFLEKLLSSAMEILKKPVKPQASDGLNSRQLFGILWNI